MRREESVLVGLLDPWVILSPLEGSERGKGGWENFSGTYSSLNFTAQRCERSEGGRQVALFTMSVLIATQLKIDTSTASRRVRGPFSMHGTLCGNVCVMGESPAPDRKGCWLFLITTGQAERGQRVSMSLLRLLMDKCFPFNFLLCADF